MGQRQQGLGTEETWQGKERWVMENRGKGEKKHSKGGVGQRRKGLRREEGDAARKDEVGQDNRGQGQRTVETQQ